MIKDHSKKYSDLTKSMSELGDKIPEIMDSFNSLHKASITKGSLSSKTKELIALGIAITVRCDGCVGFHVHDAINAGATSQEVLETIGVAILMGGGPAVVYGAEAMEALEQFIVLEN
jgi:AhpD family alkylhydroperoxidase